MISKYLDLKPLIEAYLFANTPMQLFSQFRVDENLTMVLGKISVIELQEEYTHRASKENRSLEDVVIAYAILVMFTLLRHNQAIEAFNGIDLKLLSWGDAILEIYNRSVITTQFETVKVRPRRLHEPQFYEEQSSFTKVVPNVLSKAPPQNTSSALTTLLEKSD